MFADGLGTSPRTEKVSFLASHILTIEENDVEIAEAMRSFISVASERFDVDATWSAFLSWKQLMKGAGLIEIAQARAFLLHNLRFHQCRQNIL